MSAPRNKFSYNWIIGLFSLQALIKCLSIFFIFVLLFVTSRVKYDRDEDNDFDYLIFTQRWLPTACIDYLNTYPRTFNLHHCILPKNYTFWAIHGLWPNKYNKMGPFFCNGSNFNVKSLELIESELEIYWPNIEGGKDVSSLWKHEWLKHGTCAAQLESLDTEFKYFNTSLSIFKLLKLQTVLMKHNVLPTNIGLDVSDLFHVLRKAFGKNPHINCIFEVKTHQPYLSEIRLCYNKNLELIDCEDPKRSKFSRIFNTATGFTNCPLDRKVIYPDRVNPQMDPRLTLETLRTKDSYDSYDKLRDALQIIRFSQWASL